MSETVLDRIKAYKLEEVAADKAARPLSDVEDAAREASPVRPFAAALQTTFISAWWQPISMRVPDSMPMVSRRQLSPPQSSPPPRGPPV